MASSWQPDVSDAATEHHTLKKKKRDCHCFGKKLHQPWRHQSIRSWTVNGKLADAAEQGWRSINCHPKRRRKNKESGICFFFFFSAYCHERVSKSLHMISVALVLTGGNVNANLAWCKTRLRISNHNKLQMSSHLQHMYTHTHLWEGWSRRSVRVSCKWEVGCGDKVTSVEQMRGVKKNKQKKKTQSGQTQTIWKKRGKSQHLY